MAQDMGPKLEKQPLSADTPWKTQEIDDSEFNEQMRQVAKLIAISKNEEFVEVTTWSVAELQACVLFNDIIITH